MTKLIDLPPKSVEYMINDNVIMIDVRRKDEWLTTGIIRDVHLMTFFDEYGNHNIIQWLKELEALTSSKDDLIVLICAHANRTRMIGNYLIQEQGYTNVTHLKGGMALWLEENREVIPYKDKD